MRLLIYGLLLLTGVTACTAPQNIQASASQTVTEFTKGMKAYPGYFNFYWDDKEGKIWLEIAKFEEEFLYVPGLAAGVGSNDIGLDRGQLGNEKIVKFMRSGPKVLLLEVNYDFRAESDNEAERKSVAEAFAQSVIAGFKIKITDGTKVLVDATDFIISDAHKVARKLKEKGQGNYSLDPVRSTIYLDGTQSFPNNSEFEALLTFKLGERDKSAAWAASVAPSGELITVRQHHSFVKLPDDNYQRRPYDPRSGYGAISFQDYATPIDQPLVKRFIRRHRLQKKDPQAAVSEAVEPIIYYLDPGAPEPVRSALLEGARWWNQAFEAIGYKNAFQVKILPDDVHPLDVRYNVIQWIHRSTRGWSYGNSVTDPRTGEIIKGHVSLGSLRVRQDFLIAQGLIDAYRENQPVRPELLEMALARLRQLSAHEVGHTLGLNHNFAGSTNQRSSVMDYPHPFIQLVNGQIDFSQAYDQKIGAWDIRTILYGYQDFPQGSDLDEELDQVIRGNIELGLDYITDRDSRPGGSAHPQAHLWDNHTQPTQELDRMLGLRRHAMEQFGEQNIPFGTPWSTLEEVFVPLYLSHRYQSEAVIKLIGGVHYNYAFRGDDQEVWQYVPASFQNEAIEASIKVLHPEFLEIPPHIRALIPPKPPEYQRGRESFKTRTGLIFDPMAAAESLAGTNLNLILNGQRATRLVQQKAFDRSLPGLQELLQLLIDNTWKKSYDDHYHQALNQLVAQLCLQRMLQLAVDERASIQARAITAEHLKGLQSWLVQQYAMVSLQQYGFGRDPGLKAHYNYALSQIDQWQKDPATVSSPKLLSMPDGSPIGSTQCDFVH